MVSCGSCGRWQHITCHDNVDHQKGYPKRNWTTQKFLCQRCASNYRSSNGRHHHSSSQHPSADGWVQPHSQKAPAPSTHAYAQPTSDTRYSQQPPYDNRGHYSGQHYPAQSSTAALYSRPQPHPVAYPQYHHEQRGYSNHTSHSSSQWQNGYSAMPDTQRYADHGAYTASRASLAYTVCVQLKLRTTHPDRTVIEPCGHSLSALRKYPRTSKLCASARRARLSKGLRSAALQPPSTVPYTQWSMEPCS